PHHHAALHSFPTRRSSDLTSRIVRSLIPIRPSPSWAIISRITSTVAGAFPFCAVPCSLRIPAHTFLTRACPEETRDGAEGEGPRDRKSTRLNSSHVKISYA